MTFSQIHFSLFFLLENLKGGRKKTDKILVDSIQSSRDYNNSKTLLKASSSQQTHLRLYPPNNMLVLFETRIVISK